MRLRRYDIACPFCTLVRIVVHDVPSQQAANNMLPPNARLPVRPDDRWRYGLDGDYVPERVAIQWADTCSNARPDAFTGGAAIVTKRRVHWLVLPEIVERRLRAIERRTSRARKTA